MWGSAQGLARSLRLPPWSPAEQSLLAVSRNRIALGPTHAERAILVGVDFTLRSRIKRAGADGARAALRLKESADSTADSFESSVVSTVGLDAEESLAEFRELVLSAGGEVAA